MIKKVNKKKVEKISSILGLHIDRIVDFLEEEESIISTVQEAQEECFKQPVESEARSLLWEKWSELSLKEVEQASTIQEIEKACNDAPPEGEIQKMALIKWVGLCSTPQEIKKVFDNHFARRIFILGGRAEKLALKKIYNLI